MRSYYSTLATLLLASAMGASAQGPLALQNNQADHKDAAPVTYSVGLGGGYDRLNYKSKEADGADIDSAFMQGSLGATFNGIDEQTPWSLGLDFGSIYYFDDTSSGDNTDYSGKISFNISHAASQRLKINDSFYATYEVEPNFGIGASTSRRNGQYLYGYNNFAISYAWSERFSTTTSYTVDTIQYDDGAIGKSEDRISHLVSQQFSWAHSKTTSWVGEYRYRTTLYDHAGDNDYISHYVLAGIDQAWSERTTGSIRAGAEFYSSDRSDKTAPYGELTISHRSTEKTSFQLYSSVGFDGSELGAFDSRRSYRTGINASHRATERFTVNGGLNYAYSDFTGAGDAPDITEHELSATAGIGYRIWDNISLDASYSHSLINSDDDFRDYSRDRVSLGVQASF
jgi:hypothetical protein